ncbi:MAG: PAS domain S-box protein [Desulfobacteraceae bacterium]|nr:PAS domain S-box protein [Desulfobacteraceae bacterium]
MSFSKKPDHLELLDMQNIDFLSILNHLDDGVMIADINGKILFYNTAQSKIDGLMPRDVIGLKVTDIYVLDNHSSLIMQVIHQHAAIRSQTFFYRTCSGKVVNTITSSYPLFTKETINGVICFVKDYELVQKSHSPVFINEYRSDLGNNTMYTFADLIGREADFMRVKHMAQKAAVSSSPIMIQGETGTGKELFAQSIHNHSPRRREQYVAVNCAAIPHDLLEGMLFGTTRGAFTGAMDKPGLFESAHGGTLFLDELLSMPVGLQAKLLRVLQEKQVRRVGSVRETSIDVKIISSMSLDPRIAIREEQLRTDLFYRLGVVMLKLRPLRERLEDMEELVTHFIGKINDRLGTHVKGISRKVHDLFIVYQWPGNIRELEHLLEGAMNMITQEEILEVEHFTPGLDSLEKINLEDWEIPVSSAQNIELSGGQYPPQSLAKIQADQEKKAVETALYASRGNVSQAAKALGISRQLLHYKIKKYKFFRGDFIPRP